MSLRSWCVLGVSFTFLLTNYADAGGEICTTTPVAVPAGWYSGDTHEHFQQCQTQEELTMADVLADMEEQHLNVSAVQVWGGWTHSSSND